MESTKKPTADLLFYGLLMLLCWLPLPLGTNRLWSEGVLITYAGLLGGITVIAIARGKLAPSACLRYSLPMQLGFLLLCSWQWAQGILFTSPDPGRQNLGLYLSLSYWLLFNLTLLLTRSERHLRLLLWVLVISGLFQACYGTLMTLSGLEWGFAGPKIFGRGVATGTFVNRNHLAGYLEMTLACGIGLLAGQLQDRHFSSSRERLQHLMQTLLSSKIILRVALGAMVIGLIMTRSRMGNTAFFSSLLICGFTFMLLRKRLSKSALILFASLVLIDTLIISQWFGLEKLASRLENTLEQTEIVDSENDTGISVKTGDERDKAWREALPMLGNYALLGRGFGSFNHLFPQHRDGSSTGYFDHAHNDYIELLIDFGLPGFLPMLFMAAYALWLAFSTQTQRRNKIAISAGFAASMGIIAIAIHSWADFNLYIPANASLFCVLLAIAVIGRHSKFKHRH